MTLIAKKSLLISGCLSMALIAASSGTVFAAGQKSNLDYTPSDKSAYRQLLNVSPVRNMTTIPGNEVAAACYESGVSCNNNSDCCNNTCVEPPGICE